jgi:hypothetical protein
MKVEGILASPAVLTAVAGLLSIISAFVGARIQRGIGRQIERDRFRHDIAAKTAEMRLTAHKELASLLAQAYRDKRNSAAPAPNSLNTFKNYYYENRYFFSNELGDAFRLVKESLSIAACDFAVLEQNVNAFFNVLRNDLLLRELSESVHRAVTSSKPKRQ